MAAGWLSKLPIGPFRVRPHLVGAILAGGAVALILAFTPHSPPPAIRAVLAWDAGCLWLIVVSIAGMVGALGKDIEKRAASQDEGRHVVLALVLICVVASLAGIGAVLHQAKGEEEGAKAVLVGLALLTAAISWFVMQLVFTLHYAHEYYSKSAEGGGRKGGLGFPKDNEPDYWDFLHFSVVIGVAAQTADVTFTSKVLRRIGTVHSVAAFTFNTVVLALAINLLASLF